jgi:hypothetical protein
VQPPDQGRPVGIRPLENLEQLPRRWFAERGDHTLPYILHQPISY